MYVDSNIDGPGRRSICHSVIPSRQVRTGARKPTGKVNHRALTRKSLCRRVLLRLSDMGEVDTKKKVYPGMLVLGLTGSIGMGKSTVGKMFVKHGIPLLDADQIVHDLYGAGGAAVPLVEASFPGTAVEGAIWRPKLSTYVVGNEAALRRLEAIVHPLVAEERNKRLQKLAEEGTARLVVVDIPLLFETHCENEVDAVVVVSAPPEVQRDRVLARPGMSPDKLQAILARQMTDEQKRKLADYVIDTGVSLEETEAQIQLLVSRLQQD
eukprot:jgi/Botrbrau1/4364/Bobra.105_2s0011.1